MNVSRSLSVFLVSLGILCMTACSGHKSPTEPDDPVRTTADFTDGVHTDFLDGTFTESDLSPLVNGPNPPSGAEVGDPTTLWSSEAEEDAHWSVVVSVTHSGSPALYDIRYAWFDDEYSPANGPVQTGSLFQTRAGIIQAVKVSACYFYDSEVGHANDSRLVVYVAFMCKASGSSNWEIGTIKAIWKAYDGSGYFPFSTQSVDPSPTVFPDMPGSNDPWGGVDYCPDIAFDPVTGNLHVVWTNHYSTPSPYYMLAYKRGTYNEDFTSNPTWTWSTQYTVKEPNAPHYMWHPRIDVGDPDGDGDKVGVVYTAYSSSYDPYPLDYHVGASFWAPNETDFVNGATYFHWQYAEDEHCGEPQIDIAPQSNTGEYVSITFTNNFSSGQYQVIEFNNKRNAFIALVHSGEEEGVYGAPVIHYESDMVTVTYFQDTGSDWEIESTRFALDATQMSNNWASIESGIDGSFSPSGDVAPPDLDAGIVTKTDNSVWAAWCDHIDTTTATDVHAAYGDSTP